MGEQVSMNEGIVDREDLKPADVNEADDFMRRM